MTICYALGVGLVATQAAISPTACLSLYLVCVPVCLATSTDRFRQVRATDWLMFAMYAAVLSAMFYGANGALDALHGADRTAHRASAELGGLTLWFVLCPGVVAVSLGAALGASVRGRLLRRTGG